MKEYSDQEVLTSIDAGGKSLENAMRFLYLKHGCRKQILAFIQNKGGSLEDAEDIFQDGIRYLVLQIRGGKYKAAGEIGAYLFGICRNLWYRRFRQIQREVDMPDQIEDELVFEEDPEQTLISKDRAQLLELIMADLGSTCRKVLELWKLSYSMKEIASALNYKNEAVARKKKRLCLVKLIGLIEDHPQMRHWLRE